jgi:hypothetical protein
MRSPLSGASCDEDDADGYCDLHDVWTMCWTPCDRQPTTSEGHFLDMHDGRQGAYLCVGLAGGSCGTFGLTQSTFGFGLTARYRHLGLAFGPLRDFLSRAVQSESVNANEQQYVPSRQTEIRARSGQTSPEVGPPRPPMAGRPPLPVVAPPLHPVGASAGALADPS